MNWLHLQARLSAIARSRMRTQMLKLGIVGIGGYAGNICDAVMGAVRDGDPVELVATCDPRPQDQPSRRDRLIASGVPVLTEYDRLLSLDIDAVWLPIPIDLHRSFTLRALAAGKAVLVEKPAAGSVEEVDDMIAARDQSGLPVAVGFQNLFEPNAWTVKEHILGGFIGDVRSASIIGCWPRSEAYYTRATWAGRALRNETWVLDSPLSNALAHFANLALFLLGDDLASSALPAYLEAELLRAYAIEMFDTCSIRVAIPSGVPLTIGMTHACRETIEPIVTIQGTRGSVRYLHEGGRFEILDHRGRIVASLKNETNTARQTVLEFAALVAGQPNAKVASLENARNHTLLVNAVSQAATISDIPSHLVRPLPHVDGTMIRAIVGIEDLLSNCVGQGCLLSELPSIPFGARTGACEIGEDFVFEGPAEAERRRKELPLEKLPA